MREIVLAILLAACNNPTPSQKEDVAVSAMDLHLQWTANAVQAQASKGKTLIVTGEVERVTERGTLILGPDFVAAYGLPRSYLAKLKPMEDVRIQCVSDGLDGETAILRQCRPLTVTPR